MITIDGYLFKAERWGAQSPTVPLNMSLITAVARLMIADGCRHELQQA